MGIEFLQSPKGLKVPVLEGKALCSRIDPLAEVESWIHFHETLCNWSEQIIVVGVGGGFHLNRLCQMYPNKKIRVLELNQELIDAYQANFETPPNLDFTLAIPKQGRFENKFKSGGRVIAIPFRAAFAANPNLYNSLLLSVLGEKSEKVDFNLITSGVNRLAPSYNDKINFLMRELVK